MGSSRMRWRATSTSGPGRASRSSGSTVHREMPRSSRFRCSAAGRERIRRAGERRRRRRRCSPRVVARSSSTISSDLPASVQRRLARILRDGEVRTSGRERVRIGARIVAAAPSSLASDARDGRVRADLLRRFAARQITLPPLRMRPEDLPAIVRHVAADISRSRTSRCRPSRRRP